MDHYRNCEFYVLATKAYRTSGSFDLFPQHCQLPTLDESEHAAEVMDELIGAMKKLKKRPTKKILKVLEKAITFLTSVGGTHSVERVEAENALVPISEGAGADERVGAPDRRVEDPPRSQL